MFYGAVAWDPWLIVAQIVCLQCLYYLSLGLFLSILVGPRVSKMSLVYFFDFATVTASTATGWCVMASNFLSSIAGWVCNSVSVYVIMIWFFACFVIVLAEDCCLCWFFFLANCLCLVILKSFWFFAVCEVLNEVGILCLQFRNFNEVVVL